LGSDWSSDPKLVAFDPTSSGNIYDLFIRGFDFGAAVSQTVVYSKGTTLTLSWSGAREYAAYHDLVNHKWVRCSYYTPIPFCKAATETQDQDKLWEHWAETKPKNCK